MLHVNRSGALAEVLCGRKIFLPYSRFLLVISRWRNLYESWILAVICYGKAVIYKNILDKGVN